MAIKPNNGFVEDIDDNYVRNGQMTIYLSKDAASGALVSSFSTNPYVKNIFFSNVSGADASLFSINKSNQLVYLGDTHEYGEDGTLASYDLVLQFVTPAWSNFGTTVQKYNVQVVVTDDDQPAQGVSFTKSQALLDLYSDAPADKYIIDEGYYSRGLHLANVQVHGVAAVDRFTLSDDSLFEYRNIKGNTAELWLDRGERLNYENVTGANTTLGAIIDGENINSNSFELYIADVNEAPTRIRSLYPEVTRFGESDGLRSVHPYLTLIIITDDALGNNVFEVTDVDSPFEMVATTSPDRARLQIKEGVVLDHTKGEYIVNISVRDYELDHTPLTTQVKVNVIEYLPHHPVLVTNGEVDGYEITIYMSADTPLGTIIADFVTEENTYIIDDLHISPELIDGTWTFHYPFSFNEKNQLLYDGKDYYGRSVGLEDGYQVILDVDTVDKFNHSQRDFEYRFNIIIGDKDVPHNDISYSKSQALADADTSLPDSTFKLAEGIYADGFYLADITAPSALTLDDARFEYRNADGTAYSGGNAAQLWLKAGVELDYESVARIELDLGAGNGSFANTLTLYIDNVNEAPTAIETNLHVRHFREGVSAERYIATISLTDDMLGENIFEQLDSNSPFEIRAPRNYARTKGHYDAELWIKKGFTLDADTDYLIDVVANGDGINAKTLTERIKINVDAVSDIPITFLKTDVPRRHKEDVTIYMSKDAGDYAIITYFKLDNPDYSVYHVGIRKHTPESVGRFHVFPDDELIHWGDAHGEAVDGEIPTYQFELRLLARNEDARDTVRNTYNVTIIVGEPPAPEVVLPPEPEPDPAPVGKAYEWNFDSVASNKFVATDEPRTIDDFVLGRDSLTLIDNSDSVISFAEFKEAVRADFIKIYVHWNFDGDFIAVSFFLLAPDGDENYNRILRLNLADEHELNLEDEIVQAITAPNTHQRDGNLINRGVDQLEKLFGDLLYITDEAGATNTNTDEDATTTTPPTDDGGAIFQIGDPTPVAAPDITILEVAGHSHKQSEVAASAEDLFTGYGFTFGEGVDDYAWSVSNDNFMLSASKNYADTYALSIKQGADLAAGAYEIVITATPQSGAEVSTSVTVTILADEASRSTSYNIGFSEDGAYALINDDGNIDNFLRGVDVLGFELKRSGEGDNRSAEQIFNDALGQEFSVRPNFDFADQEVDGLTFLFTQTLIYGNGQTTQSLMQVNFADSISIDDFVNDVRNPDTRTEYDFDSSLATITSLNAIENVLGGDASLDLSLIDTLDATTPNIL